VITDVPLRVFLASPTELIPERELVRSAFDRYNTTLRREGERPFEFVGWEQIRATAWRPQDDINPLIGTTEFMIVLFKSSWGTDPGGPFGYTSGTEEELFTGLLALGLRDQPLEDMWVGFIDDPAPAVEIVELQAQLHQRHSFLYEKIADSGDLEQKLIERLVGWQKNAGTKTARWLDLLPRSGRDVLGAARKRIQGESLIQLGQTDAGFQLLEEASQIGGPREHLAFARALGRRGQLEQALAVVRIAIAAILSSRIEVHSAFAGEAFLTEAGLLRRLGQDLEAVNRLGTISGELDGKARDAWPVRARILDERGLANQRLNRIEDARADFGASLELRRERGRAIELAQSLVNLIRLEVREQDLAAADELASEMLEALRGGTPSALHANAWTAVAQLRLREGRAQEGIPFALQALLLNEQTSNTSGVAKCLMVLTQCSRAAGDLESARAYAERCIAVNESMGNAQGVESARWQLDRLDER